MLKYTMSYFLSVINSNEERYKKMLHDRLDRKMKRRSNVKIVNPYNNKDYNIYLKIYINVGCMNNVEYQGDEETHMRINLKKCVS